ncbi:hypothetical protein Tco_0077617 [Tanacetum coccineum]
MVATVSDSSLIFDGDFRVAGLVEERFRVDKAGDTIYRSFRSRRQIADCTALIEQSWWKLLDFAEPKRSFMSFFILTQTKDGHFVLVHSRGLLRLENAYEKLQRLKGCLATLTRSSWGKYYNLPFIVAHVFRFRLIPSTRDVDQAAKEHVLATFSTTRCSTASTIALAFCMLNLVLFHMASAPHVPADVIIEPFDESEYVVTPAKKAKKTRAFIMLELPSSWPFILLIDIHTSFRSGRDYVADINVVASFLCDSCLSLEYESAFSESISPRVGTGGYEKEVMCKYFFKEMHEFVLAIEIHQATMARQDSFRWQYTEAFVAGQRELQFGFESEMSRFRKKFYHQPFCLNFIEGDKGMVKLRHHLMQLRIYQKLTLRDMLLQSSCPRIFLTGYNACHYVL